MMTLHLVIACLTLAACARAPSVPRAQDVEEPKRVIDAAVSTELTPTDGWPFAVKSDIPTCLTLKGGPVFTLGNLVLADVTVTSIHGVWECGCLSKSLLFRSVNRYNDIDAELASGVIRSPDPGTSLVDRVLLSASPDIPANGSMVLHMGCRPPP